MTDAGPAGDCEMCGSDEHRIFLGGLLHAGEEAERTVHAAPDDQTAVEELRALVARITNAYRDCF